MGLTDGTSYTLASGGRQTSRQRHSRILLRSAKALAPSHAARGMGEMPELV